MPDLFVLRSLPRMAGYALGRLVMYALAYALSFGVLMLPGRSYGIAGLFSNGITAPARPGDSSYTHGMVVSAYPDASKAGVDILRKGGNAVDAAIAVQFALAVVYPSAGNIGGGGFMVIRTAAGKADCVDFREEAPGKASHDMYLDRSGNVIPDASTLGFLAAGVPGSVDGMVEAHKRYGKLPWKELVQPAVDLARDGFRLTAREAAGLNRAASSLEKLNGTKCSLLSSTGAWQKGDILRQAALARTLTAIMDQGREGFYAGPVAASIAADITSGHGLITLKDLAAYHAVWRNPVTGSYRGFKIISMPPPSSGGVALLQLLASVESYNLSALGHNTAAAIQLYTEAERRVYADRAYYLGDPDFVEVPVSTLVSTGYNKDRMTDFNASVATPSTAVRAGPIPGYANLTPHIHKEKLETTHFSVADQWGNAVSVTTTLNDGFGSKVVLQGTGMVLNNEMDDFSVQPGHPNAYGLTGGEANAIQPGKRMLSSMTPTIVERDGHLFMVLGSPGGATIITTVFQTIVNVIDYKMGVRKAVTVRRVHSQWLPDKIYAEHGAMSDSTVAKLKTMGHLIEFIGSADPGEGGIGRMDAILVSPGNHLSYEGGADPRGDDTAAGYP